MFDGRITELWERPGERARFVNYHRAAIKCENLKKSSWGCCDRAGSVATEQSIPRLSEYVFATHGGTLVTVRGISSPLRIPM